MAAFSSLPLPSTAMAVPPARHKPTMDCRLSLRFALRMVAILVACGAPVLAAEQNGKQIYAHHCAKCHGENGEGSDEEYPERLIGELSVGELARLIDKTMPLHHPEKIGAEESLLVSAYVHDAFYSPVAQERNRPARIELSRLTVRQYQNAVSDLVGSFRRPAPSDKRQGLKAEYYKGRRIRNEDKVEERIDELVNFDFGTASPLPGRTEDYEFSIHWEGTVFAPDTGEYEFTVHTEHACRLWINDTDKSIIDAWVKSGNDTDYKATIYLLGGRTYPIQLEFSKAKQGVDDSAKQKKKPESQPATIRLLWKPPHGTLEPVPARCLSPASAPERFVLTTPFPPDDRSVGYERGNAISRAWDNSTTDAALEVAAYVSAKRVELAGVNEPRVRAPNSPSFRNTRRRPGDEDRTPDTTETRAKKIDEFCRKFLERAFRRPIADDEKEFFIDRQFAETNDEETAVKRVVLLALKTPRFLYRELGEGSEFRVQGSEQAEGSSQDAYAVASRLSFGLWDSLPDAELLKAAADNKLVTHEEVAAQAERMMADPRARSKIREFLLQWLKVDQPPEIAKDKDRFPDFTEEVAADLRTSLDLFLDDVVWSDASDFRELLQSNWVYLNGRLAQLYRPDLPLDAPFMKMQFAATERTGVLTHPYLMAGFAYTATSSPIHRGVFIARSVLGRSLRPPPIAVSPLPLDLHKDLTTRERITLQTKPEACQSCHAMINPLGFTLENFDAVGRFRTEDAGKPIDPTGGYRTRTGEMVKFHGVRELADFLAESDETRSTFAEQLFHYMIKQPVRAYGADALPQLRQAFTANRYSIRRLAADIVTTAALNP
jgi:mono/diheme cytochrome c family protein